MFAGFVVLRLPSKSGAIWRCFRCLGAKRDARTPCKKGDRFSVPLFTRVGARDAACGFGFGWAAGLVSVTVWLRFLLRVALAAVTAAETEFPLRSKWFPLHPAPFSHGDSPFSNSPGILRVWISEGVGEAVISGKG